MKQEFVTLPREVVERVLEALTNCTSEYGNRCNRCDSEVDPEAKATSALRAALEQTAAGIPESVPAGWKLVPVEPNCGMVFAGERSLEQHDLLRLDSAYRAMLAAAPNPPALEQPQANQPVMTPIAQRKLDSLLTEGYTISGYSVYHERKHQHGFVTGAGLVGWWKPDGVEYPQRQGEQPLRYLDGGSRYKVTHLKTSGYCIIGLPEDLLGRWVALVDATDNKHMDSHQQPPTTDKSSVVQPQGEQKPRAWLHIDRLGGEQAFTNEPPPSLKAKCQPLYTHSQNLNCKSTQARLATLWGYVKEQPKREPLTHYEIHELFRRSWDDCQDGDEIKAFARAIEAAHNIK